MQQLHLPAQGLGQGVQPGNLPETDGGGIHPEGIVRYLIADVLELQVPEHRHGNTGDVLLTALHMAGTHQVLQTLIRGEGIVLRENGHPIVQPVHGGTVLLLHLLQLGGDLHHHGLKLLLFQLQGGQVALKLLQAVLLHLQLVFCEFNSHRRPLTLRRRAWAISPE